MGRKRNIILEHDDHVFSVSQLTWEKFLLAKKEGKDVSIANFPTRELGVITYHLSDMSDGTIDMYLEDLYDL